ncbi:hypothetical protein HZA39_00590 [Candidatus Peregrinibacteria bacterium]|nr:hypothetical protein [Candidatus Peregrinibacteria bacterium]
MSDQPPKYNIVMNHLRDCFREIKRQKLEKDRNLTEDEIKKIADEVAKKVQKNADAFDAEMSNLYPKS